MSGKDELRRIHISIHAPREGGDDFFAVSQMIIKDFNPRPPRGGRLRSLSKMGKAKRHFNPRPPRGGRPA